MENIPVELQDGVLTVLYRWTENMGEKGIQYLLFRRISNWKGIEFCKGAIDPGESAKEAALREVEEETGVALEGIEETGEELEYSYMAYDKGNERLIKRHFTVFAADITGKKPRADGREHAWLRFAPYEGALKLLSFDDTRELLEKLHPRLSS